MKLKGGKFKTDQRKYFYMTCVQAEELPLQEIVKASNVVGFEKGWRLDGQCEC